MQTQANLAVVCSPEEAKAGPALFNESRGPQSRAQSLGLRGWLVQLPDLPVSDYNQSNLTTFYR